MIIEVQEWLTPTERRIKIINILYQRRYETMKNLAREFEVSLRTINYDIEYLLLSYPLETIRGRYGGGVKIIGDYNLYRKYLNTKQIDLLERVKGHLSSKDIEIINSILNDFVLGR